MKRYAGYVGAVLAVGLILAGCSRPEEPRQVDLTADPPLKMCAGTSPSSRLTKI
jgi:hypothetical protein